MKKSLRLVLSLSLLFVVLGGASVTAATNLARNSVTSRAIKDRTIQKVDLSRTLFNTLNNRSGGTFSGSTSLGSDGTVYVPVTSTMLAELASTNPDHTTTLSPNHTLTARNLAVRIDPFLNDGSLTVKLFLNGAPTTFSCTITGFGSSCNSGTKTLNIPPASRMTLQITSQALGTGGETFLYFGFGV